jgi:hypothetical protein
MVEFLNKKIIINDEVFYDVTDVTTSGVVMNYEEAEALTNGKVITTSG